MLTIELGEMEYYNTHVGEFDKLEGGIITLEYSLKAVYDWEGIFKKPFLKSKLSDEEFKTFIQCMSDKPFDPAFLTREHVDTIMGYISDPRTATTFGNRGQNGGNPKSKRVQTSEEIYAIMCMNNVPLEWENRNLNRLLTMLNVIVLKSQPPKKMSREEVYRQNAELNKKRRAEMKTKG